MNTNVLGQFTGKSGKHVDEMRALDSGYYNANYDYAERNKVIRDERIARQALIAERAPIAYYELLSDIFGV